MDADRLDKLCEAWIESWTKQSLAVMPPDWITKYGQEVQPSYGEVFAAGYHERDAEIERLRAGITRLKALTSLPGDSPGLPCMRLGMIRQEATELLKGGGDGC